MDTVAVSAPDLVVLDWQLPGMNGIQACRKLRARSGIPVIMITGSRNNSRETALTAGASEYLVKPFSIDDLLKCIEAALEPIK